MRIAFADASAQFSQQFLCPIERVGVRFEQRVVNAPPPDVAADLGLVERVQFDAGELAGVDVPTVHGRSRRRERS